jgi:hypothetical protein
VTTERTVEVRLPELAVAEALAEIPVLRRRIRDLTVIVLAGGVAIAVAFFAFFNGQDDVRSAQLNGEVRGYKNRAIDCFETGSLVGKQNLPSYCLEDVLIKPLPGRDDPIFDPNALPLTTATLTQTKTRELFCGLLRSSDSGREYVEKFEREQGEKCEDPPKAP